MTRLIRIPLAAALLAAGGCTVDRMHHDVGRTLDHARLRNASTANQALRWLLPPTARVIVTDLAPGPDGWLAAAQAGVAQVFAAAPEGRADFELQVLWPPGDGARGARLPFVPDFAGSTDVRVLVRAADAELVGATTIRLTPHLLGVERGRKAHVRAAFSEFAASLAGPQ